jgi:hypothetical protein
VSLLQSFWFVLFLHPPRIVTQNPTGNIYRVVIIDLWDFLYSFVPILDLLLSKCNVMLITIVPRSARLNLHLRFYPTSLSSPFSFLIYYLQRKNTS